MTKFQGTKIEPSEFIAKFVNKNKLEMKSLQIKNYKNLKDFKIDSLTRVNLIVGKNNVGKSTLLEAISIFATGGDVNWIKEILDMRGESAYSLSDASLLTDKFLSLYSERDLASFYHDPVYIKSNYQLGLLNIEDALTLKLIKFIRTRKIDENGITQIATKIVDINDKSEFTDANAIVGLLSNLGEKKTIYSFEDPRGRRVSYNKIIPFEYVRTSQISSDKNPQLFDKIALTLLEKEIINALRIIEPKIDAINFLNDESYRSIRNDDNRVPIVIFPMSTERYKLSSMGDGVNRILTIILALLNCKDGILLIDEFENGLHYTVQTQLWKMVYQLAEKLNVQVFATTHSDDCIKSFVAAGSNPMGKLIRLENRDGNIVPIGYDEKDELDYISTSNLEIR